MPERTTRDYEERDMLSDGSLLGMAVSSWVNSVGENTEIATDGYSTTQMPNMPNVYFSFPEEGVGGGGGGGASSGASRPESRATGSRSSIRPNGASARKGRSNPGARAS